ncbi:Serine/threonine transporter SstT [Sinobacterium norvegicum]|uniref:Serine/threonine transporter SstT n=2 Tax=Sinobacterium norvegicum TaxID=1641715 RepID=A0ABN8EF74_9GAMM|nr:Serine/threonine transporter SstT [Sinobacterium norvegicum]
MLARYFQASLVKRIMWAFVLGCIIGGIAHAAGWGFPEKLAVLGDIFVAGLKAVVIPVIFFSLLSGATTIETDKFGSVGKRVVMSYGLTILVAALVGTIMALSFNVGSGFALEGISSSVTGAQNLGADSISGTLYNTFIGALANPFSALSSSNFLGVIVAALVIGIALKVNEESHPGSPLVKIIGHVNDTMLTIVGWVMHFAPIGIFGIVVSSIGVYGATLAGTFASILGALVAAMVFVALIVYPLTHYLLARQNPYAVMWRIFKTAGVTAFFTRSSAATLPVSIATMDDMGVDQSVSRFALPIGATMNMTGAAITVAVFTIFAANVFEVHLGLMELMIVIFSAAIVSVGAGGVPSGSLMLLFVSLNALGLSADQSGLVVGLAFTLTAIQDSFETCLNVFGDNVITHGVDQSLKS